MAVIRFGKLQTAPSASYARSSVHLMYRHICTEHTARFKTALQADIHWSLAQRALLFGGQPGVNTSCDTRTVQEYTSAIATSEGMGLAQWRYIAHGTDTHKWGMLQGDTQLKRRQQEQRSAEGAPL